MEKSSEQSIRLDKWLKIARIFKTRSQATKACDENQIKVNGEIAKAAKLIKPGDKLTVKAHSRFRELEILIISFKSISAREARELYREEPSETLSDESLQFMKLMRKPLVRFPGKPSKKERRSLIKIRGY